MKRKLSCFTIVELLVVVAVITILFSILIPSLAKAKYFAHLSSCKSNLRRIAAGVTAYANDNNRNYPIGGSSDMLGRIRSWDISDHSSFDALAQYYHPTGTYGDYRDLKVAQELWQCSQGLKEVPWEADYSWTNTASGAKANYSMYFNIYSGCSNYEWVDGIKVFSEPERVMQKIGDQFTFDAFQNNWGWTGIDDLKYDILASDIVHRYDGTGMGTNHVWLGDRTTQVHFSYKPLYWWTTDGRPTANYAFADGSVDEYTSDASTWRDDMHMSGRAVGFGGDQYILPKSWGEE